MTMARYRSRPSEVEAIQYGPEFHEGLVQEIAEFIAGQELDGDGELLYYVQPHGAWDPPDPKNSTVQIRAGKDGAQGWVPVPLGYWVVRQPGDLTDHWPVEGDYFQTKYERIEDG